MGKINSPFTTWLIVKLGHDPTKCTKSMEIMINLFFLKYIDYTLTIGPKYFLLSVKVRRAEARSKCKWLRNFFIQGRITEYRFCKTGTGHDKRFLCVKLIS